MSQDPDKRIDDEEADSLLPFDEHVEEVQEGDKKVRHRGVYLLPNLFTTAALFSGFYAIISAMHGRFEVAAIAIFVAMVFDGLDGRVARMTNTSSAFGEQFDSLADMVSFGVAPALVIFNWGLVDLGKVGWAAAFGFTACAALRLARFNTQIGTVDKSQFVGLASPSAAALIAAMVWVGHDVDVEWGIATAATLITILAALLMVSNVRYASFKGIDFRGRVPFVAMLAVVLVFVVITIDPARVLLVMAVSYAFSGPVCWLWQRRNVLFKRREPAVAAQTTSNEDGLESDTKGVAPKDEPKP
ncbi:CDP-diacylglycerol--serine O-phosphatidyltransferase [uncultured Gilvimarinus sp.]|uniref:CDP-diacylglycerol--serine O-phosphatidyltransferase n=1 Tax=uncultured Gilvimarinus sp. TaxID=1689143 RepID=UPI0030DAB6C0